MTVREVLVYPHPSLLTVAKPVELLVENHQLPKEAVDLAMDMLETVKAYSAAGLAATQIGSDMRIFVIGLDLDDDSAQEPRYTVCINPEVTRIDSETTSIREGCLSFPSINEPIKRSSGIAVRYIKETGEVVEEELSGLRAVAFQHELDHLNGVLFITKMGNAQKYLALKKLGKLKQKILRRFKSKKKD